MSVLEKIAVRCSARCTALRLLLPPRLRGPSAQFVCPCYNPQEIEKEMARTQKNKATAGHLGMLKVGAAKRWTGCLCPALLSVAQRQKHCLNCC